MLPRLKKFYGVDLDAATVKKKLGRPQINLKAKMPEYCEHTLDYDHVISFEFEDTDFNDLSEFMIDG